MLSILSPVWAGAGALSEPEEALGGGPGGSAPRATPPLRAEAEVEGGAEFIAQAPRRWLGAVGVGTLYIEPGSPWENGYAENFHERFRDEFLAMEIFEGLHQWGMVNPT